MGLREGLVLVLAAAMLGAGCATSPGPLAGSWVVVNYTGERPDPDGLPTGTAGRAVKILTSDRFAFGNMSGSDVFSGGGRYELEGDTYRETIEYHWVPELVGKTVEFDCEIDGDLWYHTGTFRVEGRDFRIREVWRRLQPAPERPRGGAPADRSGTRDPWW